MSYSDPKLKGSSQKSKSTNANQLTSISDIKKKHSSDEWECENCSHANRLQNELCQDCGESHAEFVLCPSCPEENPPENTHCFNCDEDISMIEREEIKDPVEPWKRDQDDIDDVMRKMEDHWGEGDIERSGYILPNGHFMNMNRPHGDHRDINYSSWSSTQRTFSGTPKMHEFMILGAIRMDAIAGTLDLAHSPTREQRQAIAKFVKYINDNEAGQIQIDMDDSPYWNANDAMFRFHRHSDAKFDSPYPGMVISKIEEFYGEG
jgi:hypothetical protein